MGRSPVGARTEPLSAPRMLTTNYIPDAKTPGSVNPADQPVRRRETTVVLAALVREDLFLQEPTKNKPENLNELPLSFVIPAKAEIQGR